MIQDDLLKRAFREFDRSGKGYITEADLARVLGGSADSRQLKQFLAAASASDREGQRVTYGSYLEVMTNVLKQTLAPGEYVYEQGEASDYFYCILSGEVDVVRTLDDGTHKVLSFRGPGEYFGELSMLEGRETHSVGIRASQYSPEVQTPASSIPHRHTLPLSRIATLYHCPSSLTITFL